MLQHSLSTIRVNDIEIGSTHKRILRAVVAHHRGAFDLVPIWIYIQLNEEFVSVRWEPSVQQNKCVIFSIIKLHMGTQNPHWLQSQYDLHEYTR
jgi:hypothetical protein